PDDLMPPRDSGKHLTPAEVTRVRDWIAAGAPFSRHWSYEPPVRATPPSTTHPSWARHDLDRFVLARLEREGLSPQPEADRRTLARRVALDLTGLPPSPAELQAFLADTRAEAYEHFVDMLLAKESFGEHWARLWLDLARYADSAGYADDPPRTIWPYRDYVIRAFNRNLPFDQFTVEQFAGDLLEHPTEEQLKATAFHRNTMTNSEGGTSDEEFRNVAIVDRVNTTFAVWMGTSMACAQCHTHKYDPITQHEYFQAFAFLNQTADADRPDESPILEFYAEDVRRQHEALGAEFAALEQSLARRNPDFTRAAAAWARLAPAHLPWLSLRPYGLRAESSAQLRLLEDQSVLVQRAATNVTQDTYTLEVPFDQATILTALRLEALAHATLEGGGPGIAGGFTVRQVKASLLPVPNQAGPEIRFLRLELPRKAVLALGEVAVYSNGDNIAHTGIARQSSVEGRAGPEAALDGRTQPAPGAPGFARTTLESQPWWELDLGTPLPVERIVLSGAPSSEPSLDGLRILALDSQRHLVWSKSGSFPKPGAHATNDLTGPRELEFATAVATTNAPSHDEAFVATDSPRPTAIHPRLGKPRERGWAVARGSGDQSLTLLLAGPTDVPRGATLKLTVQQQATAENQTLGRLRLAATGDPRAADHVDTPAPVLAALRVPKSRRSAAERSLLVNHFVRHLAPTFQSERTRLATLEAERAALKALTVPVLREMPPQQRRTTKVQLRGNYLITGDEVTEGVPAAWHPLPPQAPRNRLTFARWLVSRDNPLTARVVVNRYWEQLFGEGIVRTSEEFGSQGEPPTHPELLDWLAVEFMERGWDNKALLRLLVTSAAYRQSSRVTPAALEKDPDNRLVSRGPRFRLSAEMVRDHALAAAGLLSAKLYGPSVRPPRPSLDLRAAFGGNLDWQTSAGEDRFRRGLYTEWRRTSPYPSMATFDAPSREICTLRRNRSNTPLQALVTLNDPVYLEAAQALARGMIESGPTLESRARHGFERTLCRLPSDAELAEITQLVTDTHAAFEKDASRARAFAALPAPPESSTSPPPAPAPTPAPASASSVAPAELAAWTAVANVLLNLDETLMKR
ncbi:MAG: DUF1553 domain-containing protein, partial [Verrucomicrobiales bacterium]|nr:DUF1553 domain-containing protein [Verrucomicrobiales bacterium]